MSQRNGPLAGIRVLDLTHIWAGPLAVRYLADLGAEVVKVEPPTARGPREVVGLPLGGWLSGDPGDEPWNRNALYVKLARNRRSVCMDLKTVEGRDAFLALVKEADVLVENFSAHAMTKLGLSAHELRRANPRLISVSLSGFGSTGPYRERVAFGPVVEAMSGLDCVFGYGPHEPLNTAMAVMDPTAASNVFALVCAALTQRNESGEGQHLEFSLHEIGATYSGPWLIDAQMAEPPRALGNRHPNMVPHAVFACAGEEAWVSVACTDQGAWERLCDLLSYDESRKALDIGGRREIEALLEADIAAWCAQRAKEEVVMQLQQHGIAAGALHTTPDMVADPQVQARGFFVPLDDGIPMPGNPIKMSALNTTQWTECPKLGADNYSVLQEWLGRTESEVDALVARGALAAGPP